MFDRNEFDPKIEKILQERTGSNFSTDQQEESYVYEVEAEREYVNRLRSQREKIQGLYSKYDVLLRDLKTKDVQIKDREKKILDLEVKCKNLLIVNEQTSLVKQKNSEIISQNHNLQRVVSDLEESYAVLHGHIKQKKHVSSQKTEELENLNEDLMKKLKFLNRKYQQKEDQYSEKLKQVVSKFQEHKIEAKKQKQLHLQQVNSLRNAVLQRDEENNLLKVQNQCLRDRVNELEYYSNEISVETEEKLQKIQKQKKCQIKVLKIQIQNLRQICASFEKKWIKSKQECQIKEISVNELSLLLEEEQKRNGEVIFSIKQQFTQQRNNLKEQLVYCQNHIAKIQRKLSDCLKKQQVLYGKIRKYQICIDAKRNLREVERQELEKINYLLSLQ